jgi:hypothetical protein
LASESIVASISCTRRDSLASRRPIGPAHVK